MLCFAVLCSVADKCLVQEYVLQSFTGTYKNLKAEGSSISVPCFVDQSLTTHFCIGNHDSNSELREYNAAVFKVIQQHITGSFVKASQESLLSRTCTAMAHQLDRHCQDIFAEHEETRTFVPHTVSSDILFDIPVVPSPLMDDEETTPTFQHKMESHLAEKLVLLEPCLFQALRSNIHDATRQTQFERAVIKATFHEVANRNFSNIVVTAGPGELRLKQGMADFDGLSMSLRVRETAASDFRPPYDMLEAPDGIRYLIDLPGCRAQWQGSTRMEWSHAEAQGRTDVKLTISGVRKRVWKSGPGTEDVVWTEGPDYGEEARSRSCGKFSVTFVVDAGKYNTPTTPEQEEDFKRQNIVYEEGVLQVFVPVKRTVARPKQYEL
mmetsp:Transcript_23898/g.51756  ORF Transcript_23898/g.51756 Transcript_23898/m.51756 type:complete len:380 (-) Transcript_23898:478-1617(-)